MLFRNHIAHNLIRIGQSLNNRGKQMLRVKCPGTITVAGKVVADLVPLGGYHQPGITKVGRQSFSGVCEGRKVKVYSVHSAAQAALRVAFQGTQFGRRYFPEIVTYDQKYIVEEWIEGIPFKKLDKPLQKQGLMEIKRFLSQCGESEELIQLAAAHTGAFCYFRDYLVKRLEPWKLLDSVREFLGVWQDAYEKATNFIPSRLSHPDLSANNILLENKTGGVVVVDNELLGVGPGWILDGRNSVLNEFTPVALGYETSQETTDFLELSWHLRWLGTALDAGDFSLGYSVAVYRDFKHKQ